MQLSPLKPHRTSSTRSRQQPSKNKQRRKGPDQRNEDQKNPNDKHYDLQEIEEANALTSERPRRSVGEFAKSILRSATGKIKRRASRSSHIEWRPKNIKTALTSTISTRKSHRGSRSCCAVEEEST